MLDTTMQKMIHCPYCGSDELKFTTQPVVCCECSEVFQERGGGLDLITRDSCEELGRLVQLNYEDRPDCSLSSNNRQHSKETYEASGYLDKLLSELPFVQLGPGGSMVLDAGCGRGHISEFLIKKGIRVLSVDVVLENISDTQNPNKIFASIDNLPVASNSFDAIISTDVLEHIYPESQEKVLKEFYRVLRPEGKLLVSYPGNRLPAHSGHYVIDLAIFFVRRFSRRVEYIGRGYGGAAHINMRFPWEITRAFRNAGFSGRVLPYNDKFLSLPKNIVPFAKILNLPIVRMFFVAQMHGLIKKSSPR